MGERDISSLLYGGRIDFSYPNVLKIGTPNTINFPFVPNGN